MANPATNINLREWVLAPVKRFSPQLSPQALGISGDVLSLTPGRAVFTPAPAGPPVLVFGGLPTAEQLGGAPYYHLLIFAWHTSGTAVVRRDRVEVRVDGQRVVAVCYPRTAVSYPLATYTAVYRIPATTGEITFTSIHGNSLNDDCFFSYAYAVPHIGLNAEGQQISLIDSQRWNMVPFSFIERSDFTLTSGDSLPLVLPTEAELNGAPFYYLGVCGATDANVTDGGIMWNGNAVALDGYLMDQYGVLHITPSEVTNNALTIFDNNPSYPQIRQISAAHTTGITITVYFSGAATEFSGYYFWAIPNIPDE